MVIQFIYDHDYPDLWRDGLWAALQRLDTEVGVQFCNLKDSEPKLEADFVLGWGAFKSPVDTYLQEYKDFKGKKGLCIAGNSMSPDGANSYDVLFYETKWYRPQINFHRKIVHAFGVNTEIYHPGDSEKIWDWMTVGAFSIWKRQELILNKRGRKIAIGEIQKNNLSESMAIVEKLLWGGVAVSDMVAPEALAKMYRATKKVYIPSTVYGGGERAVLEARACGIPVEVELDNPKLHELQVCEIPDHKLYSQKLKEGILSCL